MGTRCNDADPQVGILSAIDDVPLSVVGDEAGGFTSGYTKIFEAGGSGPPLSYIFYGRIKNHVSDNYDRVRLFTGTGIHELGHALGIVGDDPSIIHTDPNANNCAMHHATPSLFTNPVFCKYHIDQLKGFNWYVK